MGCDIHGVFQTRYSKESLWRTEMEIEDGRNYLAFSALAGVRNYTGVTPISEPRGLPDDFDMKEASKVMRYGDPNNPWMGDHSFSWLTLDEIRSWDGWDQIVNDNGVITRKQYEEWDHETTPYPHSGDIWGGDVVLADQRGSCPTGWTHIRVYWSESLREYCDTFLKWLDYADAKRWTGEARIVFGFDS